MSEWIKGEIKKDVQRWKKRPEIYIALFTSLGVAFFLTWLGYQILERPRVKNFVYDIPYSTGFELFILGLCWAMATWIVGLLVDMFVDKELVETEGK